MSQKELCPCGSGKSRQLCCVDQPTVAKKLRQVGIWAGIFIVAGVLTTVAMSFDRDEVPTAAPVDPTAPAAPAVARIPQAWEYNTITNQHWDPRPGHEHWHAGPPPVNTAALEAGAQAPTVAQGTASANQAAIPGKGPPQPWEYDPAGNRHFDPTPGHVHWHDGPPPVNPSALSASSQGGASANQAPTGSGPPQPWEYDVAGNRHYDPTPGHIHWHDGPPPANKTATNTFNPGQASANQAPTGSGPPQPWEYDAAGNRHYDPTPGHLHWHDGPPPLNR